MQPKHSLRPRKKPAHFLASMALHMFLGGLLVYFYSNLQPEEEQQSTEAPVVTNGGRGLAAPPESPPGPSRKLSAPTATAKENVLEKIAEPELRREDARSEILQPALPAKDKLAATLPSPAQPDTGSPHQKRTMAEEFSIDKDLKPDISSPKRYPPAPVLRPKKIEPLLPLEPTPPAAPSGIGVARAQFTTGIEQQEPVDQVGPIILAKDNEIKQLYYFTEIKGMRGETIIHRWEHEGKIIAKVHLQIGSNQWRTYSRKNLTPAMAGNWQVVVTNSQGNPIHTDRFVYVKP